MSKVDPLQNLDPVSLEGLDQVFSGDKVSALFESDDDDDDLDEIAAFESDLSLMQEIAALQSELGSIEAEALLMQAADTESAMPVEAQESDLPADLFTRECAMDAHTKDLDELARQDLDQLARQSAAGNATSSGTKMFDESDYDFTVRPVKSRAERARKATVENRKRPADVNVEEVSNQADASAQRAGQEVQSNPPTSPNLAAASALQDALVAGDDRVSRGDLVNILEGFVRILRKDDAGGRLNLVRAQQLMNVAPEEVDIRVEDKTAELEEMRRLVIEAQETIIKLLTDRVEDRARIATLEAEVRLLPDLQEQADRAMAVAFKTEEFRSELHRVKFELERYRLSSARALSDRGPRAIFNRVRNWFLKAHGLRLRRIAEPTPRQSPADKD